MTCLRLLLLVQHLAVAIAVADCVTTNCRARHHFASSSSSSGDQRPLNLPSTERAGADVDRLSLTSPLSTRRLLRTIFRRIRRRRRQRTDAASDSKTRRVRARSDDGGVDWRRSHRKRRGSPVKFEDLVSLSEPTINKDVARNPLKMLYHKKTGRWLRILTNGTITSGEADLHCVLKFVSMGQQNHVIVKIFGPQSRMYLAMRKKGGLYGTTNPDDRNTDFFHNYFAQSHDAYVSVPHGAAVALNRKGRPVRHRVLSNYTVKAQFLARPARPRLRERNIAIPQSFLSNPPPPRRPSSSSSSSAQQRHRSSSSAADCDVIARKSIRKGEWKRACEALRASSAATSNNLRRKSARCRRLRKRCRRKSKARRKNKRRRRRNQTSVTAVTSRRRKVVTTVPVVRRSAPTASHATKRSDDQLRATDGDAAFKARALAATDKT